MGNFGFRWTLAGTGYPWPGNHHRCDLGLVILVVWAVRRMSGNTPTPGSIWYDRVNRPGHCTSALCQMWNYAGRISANFIGFRTSKEGVLWWIWDDRWNAAFLDCFNCTGVLLCADVPVESVWHRKIQQTSNIAQQILTSAIAGGEINQETIFNWMVKASTVLKIQIKGPSIRGECTKYFPTESSQILSCRGDCCT